MAKTKQTALELTPAEVETILKARSGDANTDKQGPVASDIVAALADAIRSTQPVAKKTAFNKPRNSPWLPKDGSPRLKLKRKSYHHGISVGDPTDPYSSRLTNEEIDLFNQLKPGSYCDGYVKVARRRDKGIDIDYPIRTASQRLRLVNQFGIRSFVELLQTCITEAAQPKKSADDND